MSGKNLKWNRGKKDTKRNPKDKEYQPTENCQLPCNLLTGWSMLPDGK